VPDFSIIIRKDMLEKIRKKGFPASIFFNSKPVEENSLFPRKWE
jgi:hypothetical protein